MGDSRLAQRAPTVVPAALIGLLILSSCAMQSQLKASDLSVRTTECTIDATGHSYWTGEITANQPVSAGQTEITVWWGPTSVGKASTASVKIVTRPIPKDSPIVETVTSVGFSVGTVSSPVTCRAQYLPHR
jgi:hypothetical protein